MNNRLDFASVYIYDIDVHVHDCARHGGLHANREEIA